MLEKHAFPSLQKNWAIPEKTRHKGRFFHFLSALQTTKKIKFLKMLCNLD